MNKVLTYSTPNDSPKIKLTKSQIDALRKAKLWPHDSHGAAYSSIGKPFSAGRPTWTDDEVALFINSGIRPSLPHNPGNEGEKCTGSAKCLSEDISRARKAVRR